MELEQFYLPFEGYLNQNNRWIKLAKLIPWEEFEKSYAAMLSDSSQGAPAKSFLMALGALLVKKSCTLSLSTVVIIFFPQLEPDLFSTAWLLLVLLLLLGTVTLQAFALHALIVGRILVFLQLAALPDAAHLLELLISTSVLPASMALVLESHYRDQKAIKEPFLTSEKQQIIYLIADKG